MHHEQSTGTHSMMHSEPMSGIWEFLTEEQKQARDLAQNTHITGFQSAHRIPF